jgi:hypothetical protein
VQTTMRTHLIVVLLSVLFFGCNDSKSSAPLYQGKSADYWIEQLHSSNEAKQLKAIEAIENLEPPAQFTEDYLIELMQGSSTGLAPASSKVMRAAEEALQRFNAFDDEFLGKNQAIGYDTTAKIAMYPDIQNKRDNRLDIDRKIDQARKTAWMGDSAKALHQLRELLNKADLHPLNETVIKKVINNISMGKEGVTVITE